MPLCHESNVQTYVVSKTSKIAEPCLTKLKRMSERSDCEPKDDESEERMIEGEREKEKREREGEKRKGQIVWV